MGSNNYKCNANLRIFIDITICNVAVHVDDNADARVLICINGGSFDAL